jgi:hypothetical protein
MKICNNACKFLLIHVNVRDACFSYTDNFKKD